MRQNSVPGWARPAPEIGREVYRLTRGPAEKKHFYHTESPFSGDGRFLVYYRYVPGRDEGEVCVMELESGEVCVVGTSTRWSDHAAAVQHWQGDRLRVVYQARGKFVAVNPDGSDVCEYPYGEVLQNSSSYRGATMLPAAT